MQSFPALTRGQGAAESILFANEGAKVVIADVLDTETRALAEEINRKSGARLALAIHLDVTRAADWRNAVDTCEREFGGLDILVNNAGILNFKRIEDTSEEEWDSVVPVNQKGIWLGKASNLGTVVGGAGPYTCRRLIQRLRCQASTIRRGSAVRPTAGCRGSSAGSALEARYRSVAGRRRGGTSSASRRGNHVGASGARSPAGR